MPACWSRLAIRWASSPLEAPNTGFIAVASCRISGFLDVFGFKLHRPEAVYLAVDVMIAINEADVLDLRADFYDGRRALHFKVFDDGHRIPVLKLVAESIPPHALVFTSRFR